MPGGAAPGSRPKGKKKTAFQSQQDTLRGLHAAQTETRRGHQDFFARHFVKPGLQTFKDLGNAANHAPGGIYELGKAAGYDFGVHHNYHPLARLGMDQLHFYGDALHHPLRHPGNTLLAALSFSGAGGALVRAGSRGAILPGAAVRTLKYTARSEAEAKRLARASGDPHLIKHAKAGTTFKAPIPASRVPHTRGAQAVADLVRGSGKRQMHKIERNLRTNRDYASRLFDEQPHDFTAAMKALRAGEFTNPLKQPIREINAGVRGGRLYRFGYIPPNWLGAKAANAIQGVGPRTLAQTRRLRSNPEFRPTAHNLLGGGISEAGMAAGETMRPGPIQTFMRGVGETIGKVTDRPAREAALVRELRRVGIKTDADILNTLQAAKAGNPRALQKVVMAARTGEKEAIKFSRMGHGSLGKLDQTAARNIFLYRWLTGSGQYAGRMLTEHPVTSATLAGLGKDAPDIHKFLKEYPQFLSTYIPVGQRGKDLLASGTQASTLWSTLPELYQTIKSIREDPRNAAEPLQPFQHAAAIAYSGHDPFTGIDLKNPSLQESLLFALNRETRSIPYMNFLPFNALPYSTRHLKSGETIKNYTFEKGKYFDSKAQRERRLFPRTKEDILLNFLFGSSYPTPVNKQVAAKMGRDQKSKGSSKKRKSTYYP
jgi:hypothetical protein